MPGQTVHDPGRLRNVVFICSSNIYISVIKGVRDSIVIAICQLPGLPVAMTTIHEYPSYQSHPLGR